MFIATAVLGCGGLLERKSWAPAIEGARNLFGFAVFASLFPSSTAAIVAIGLVPVVWVAAFSLTDRRGHSKRRAW